MAPCTDTTPVGTEYPRPMTPLAKLVLLVALVAVAFWLLTKFRDNGRNRR
ncbi:hypothetical protein GCM10025782_35190 [Pedococcus ginsenosidimutans]|uniref:Gram-positive cocci surface proteins LPxTG domain-containing protein n=1 Tax=Pedococcus ginsenosidimutans TaxID=490570 RepID=A0ABP8YMF6_9MICO